MTLTIPVHPPIDIAALQAVADGVSSGLAKITLRSELCALHEPDTRPKYAGCNKLAIRTPCADCKGTGEGVDGEGYPAKCEPCRGLGELHESPHMPVAYVVVDIGHRTTIEIGQLDHPPGVWKGRRDLFRARTHDELAAIVKTAVGQAAFEVAKSDGGEAGLEHDRAMLLLDTVTASGAVNADVVEQHRQRRIDARSRNVPAHLARLHPTKPAVEVMFVRSCTACTRTISAPSPDVLDDQGHHKMTAWRCDCGGTTITKEITRANRLDSEGRPVEHDIAEIMEPGPETAS